MRLFNIAALLVPLLAFSAEAQSNNEGRAMAEGHGAHGAECANFERRLTQEIENLQLMGEDKVAEYVCHDAHERDAVSDMFGDEDAIHEAIAVLNAGDACDAEVHQEMQGLNMAHRKLELADPIQVREQLLHQLEMVLVRSVLPLNVFVVRGLSGCCIAIIDRQYSLFGWKYYILF
jgi:hypothetical protein